MVNPLFHCSLTRTFTNLIGLLLILMAVIGCTVVEPGQVGVKTTLGAIQDTPLEPGLHVMIPALDRIKTYSTRVIALPEDFTSLTSDGQSMQVAATATYSINAQKAAQIFATVGETDDAIQKKIVIPVLLGSVKDVISRYQMFEIIENQKKIADEVTGLIQERLTNSELVDFRGFVVTGFVLDPEVQRAIEGKQVANQRLEQKKTEVEIAKQEAARLKALQDAITPSNLMKEAIDKWNGSGIPPTVGNGSLNLLIQP